MSVLCLGLQWSRMMRGPWTPWTWVSTDAVAFRWATHSNFSLWSWNKLLLLLLNTGEVLACVYIGAYFLFCFSTNV